MANPSPATYLGMDRTHAWLTGDGSSLPGGLTTYSDYTGLSWTTCPGHGASVLICDVLSTQQGMQPDLGTSPFQNRHMLGPSWLDSVHRAGTRSWLCYRHQSISQNVSSAPENPSKCNSFHGMGFGGRNLCLSCQRSAQTNHYSLALSTRALQYLKAS